MRRPAPALVLVVAGMSPALASRGPETGFLNRTVVVDGEARRYQVYVPADYVPTRRWPVILFLHGAGERGADGLLQTEVGLGRAIRRSPDRYPAIVVFPQAPLDSRWQGDTARIAVAALDRTLAEFSADPDRVYLSGLSMGGNGTWYLAYEHAERFAALVPICGWVAATERFPGFLPVEGGSPYAVLARRIQGLPVWIFHGEVDPVVPVTESRAMAEALRAAGASAQYTELPGVGHESWDAAYQSPSVQAWLFAQRRRPPH